MKYLKLGPKATVFYDPLSRILIRGTEIVAMKAVQKSKKLSQALNQGHVAWATELEYNQFLGEGPVAKEMEKPENRLEAKDELYDLPNEDFLVMVKESGFTAKEQKAIIKDEDPIKKYREIEATYE